MLLWADTFNNHFHPETSRAAVEVLEAAGFQVDVPRARLCCGRPLYDYGMLPLAKRLLRRILDELRDEIRAGTPLVVLEPSCAAVFRDELINLYPDDADAQRLHSQTFVLAELLQQRAADWEAPRLGRRAIVQPHCHQKAVIGMVEEDALLERLGIEKVDLPDPGCCGLAGSFGYEAGERHEVSMKAGERVILPAVREAAADTLLLADGFSCRSQIRAGAHRQALHIADAMRLALHPELEVDDAFGEAARPNRNILAGAAAGAGVLALAMLARRHLPSAPP